MKTLINISWTIVGLEFIGFIFLMIDKELVKEDFFGIAITLFYAIFTYRAHKIQAAMKDGPEIKK